MERESGMKNYKFDNTNSPNMFIQLTTSVIVKYFFNIYVKI